MPRFKPGQSGNPKGRPRGNVTAAGIRAAIAEHADEIIQSVITAAKGGDIAACKILLDRICPALKVSLEIPDSRLSEQPVTKIIIKPAEFKKS